jgi:hypothetical protein
MTAMQPDRDPNIPPETLGLFVPDEHMVRVRIANHPNTPPETLVFLSTDNESSVRAYVAKNPNTPPETLKILATDEDLAVRYFVAKNPNTPSEVLVHMGTNDVHEDPEIRYNAGINYVNRVFLMSETKEGE